MKGNISTIKAINEKAADQLVRTIGKTDVLCVFCKLNDIEQILAVEEPGEEQALTCTLFCPHCNSSFDIFARCNTRQPTYIDYLSNKASAMENK